MRGTTRRGFLAGALAGGALPVPAARAQHPPARIVQAKQELVRRGRDLAADPDGTRLVVAHDQRRTVGILGAAERHVDVGGQPNAVAVAPDGRLAAVVTAFWDEPGLALVDVGRGSLVRRLDVGPAPHSVAFAAEGTRLVVSGGETDGTVHVLDGEGREVTAQRAVGVLPRGVAADPDRRTAWVTLAGEDRVVRVDLADGRVRGALATPPLPERVAVAPDGGTLLVCHSGLGAARVSEVDVRSGAVTRREAGRFPSAVAWAADGRRVVAVGGAGEIVVFGEHGAPARHTVGGSPRGLAVAGVRAYTVDALTGGVTDVAL